MGSLVTVCGQVTYRRAISKKLVFYDVQCQSTPVEGGSSDSCGRWLEVVVKADVLGSIQQVKDIRDTVKLGDIVKVEGRYESQHVMQATAVQTLQTWQEHNAGVAFTPQPSLLHCQLADNSKHLEVQVQQQEQCHNSILQGDAGDPIINQQQLGSYADSHESLDPRAATPPACTAEQAAALVQPPQLAVCKFWVNSGRCAKGSACPYSHLQPAALRTSRGSWLQARQHRRQVLSTSLGFVHNDSAASKRQRAQHFAAWLLETFGRERLNAGAGVLDVAGGAGATTYELSVVHGIKCTLVDPRQLKLNKLQHKQLKQLNRMAELTVWTAENLLSEQDIQCDVVQVQPLTSCSLRQVVGGGAIHEQYSIAAVNVAENVVQFQQVRGWFGPDLWRSSRWQQLFGNCSVVIGLHPDQATEPIVDYALETGKAFAVMPCCVFPRLFPNRQLVEGDDSTPVVTYSQLVEYLVVKGQAQRQVLAYEGANTVVFRL